MKRNWIIGLVFVLSLVSCSSLKKSRIEINEVKMLTKKVADWQISTFADMGKYRVLPSPENRKKFHHRKPDHDLEWHCGALFAGMYEWSKIAGDDKYVDWLRGIGERNNWQLHRRMYHVDDHAVGQFYISLSQHLGSIKMIEPTQARFDSILVNNKGKKLQWHWCDALFMAPPVWARLVKVFLIISKYMGLGHF